MRHSLFFRFFLTLVLLGVVPTTIAALFLVATYHARIADAVSLEVARELLLNAAIQFFLIILFIVIIATFVAFIVSRNIAKSLGVLMRAAQKIAGGDLRTQIKVTSGDEVGKLAIFFNQMVSNIKEAQDRQEEISKLKSEFIAVAAHQLRTPLSAMKWSHQMLLAGDMGELKKVQTDILEKAEVANESMISLVHNLLDAARIEEGRFGYKFTEINLPEFLAHIIQEKSIFADERQVKLRLGEGAGERLLIRADPERLAIAVGNIIDNGIRYSLGGGLVDLSLKNEKSSAVIAVKDNGIGISRKDQEKLFTKFYRGAAVLHLETLGTGLGLFISKNIILSHGGDIWFESEKAKGTTFFIRLPKTPFPSFAPVLK